MSGWIMLAALFIGLAVSLGPATSSAAEVGTTADAPGDEAIREVATAGPVLDVLLLKDGAFVRTGEGYARLEPCDETLVCARPVGRVELPRPTPAGALPDGTVSAWDKGDVAEAWYAEPTRRYDHGILGDSFEAAKLVVRTRAGDLLDVQLPPDSVFEDLTPRLADLDDDGTTEIVTIVSNNSSGSRLSIWGVVEGEIVKRAATDPIGEPRRWLNPLPLNDGGPLMAVITPHLGGPLLQWSFKNGSLSEGRQIGGDVLFSNHAIGSRDQSLAVRQDDHWAVPEKGRKTLVFGEGDRITGRLPLGFAVADDMALVGRAVVLRSAEGALYAVETPW